MKILILGGEGNLGQQLQLALEKDNNVISWDRSEIDITDKTLVLKKITEDLKPEIVINCAAYNAVDKCEEDAEQFEIAKKVNGEAPGILAEACLKIGATLVHYSSDYVFGGHAHHHEKTIKEIKAQGGFLETDEQHPINKYGETKLMGEKEIIKYSGKGLKWYLIRTSKLFGPKGKSEAAKPSFFDIMLKLSKEKPELDVVDEEMSCFTYTPDLAEATVKLLIGDKGYGIYHIVNSSPCTWYKAAKELFKISGSNIKVNSVKSDKFPRPAKRPKYSVLKNTKWDKLRDFKEALKEYVRTTDSH